MKRHPSSVAQIITAFLSFCVVTLLSIVGWFTIHYVGALERNLERIDMRLSALERIAISKP